MNVIPVFDLKQGVVVRGVGGRRDDYRPIASVLAADSTPAAVAEGFVETLSSRTVYVADLDAIAGTSVAAPFDWASYTAIHNAGLAIWLDAGVGTAARAEQLLSLPRFDELIGHVIVGLESLESPVALAEIASVVGAERCVFSLDLKHGVPITRCDQWQGTAEQAIDDIIDTVLDASVGRMIVLDLAGVGEDAGVCALDVCRRAAKVSSARGTPLQLISGGGVRGIDDLAALADAGCSAALVASALHDGRITADDIAELSA